MGWNSGGNILYEIAKDILPHVPSHESRQALLEKWISLFEDEDCDALEEIWDYGLRDPAWADALMASGYPDPRIVNEWEVENDDDDDD